MTKYTPTDAQLKALVGTYADQWGTELHANQDGTFSDVSLFDLYQLPRLRSAIDTKEEYDYAKAHDFGKTVAKWGNPGENLNYWLSGISDPQVLSSWQQQQSGKSLSGNALMAVDNPVLEGMSNVRGIPSIFSGMADPRSMDNPAAGYQLQKEYNPTINPEASAWASNNTAAAQAARDNDGGLLGDIAPLLLAGAGLYFGLGGGGLSSLFGAAEGAGTYASVGEALAAGDFAAADALAGTAFNVGNTLGVGGATAGFGGAAVPMFDAGAGAFLDPVTGGIMDTSTALETLGSSGTLSPDVISSLTNYANTYGAGVAGESGGISGLLNNYTQTPGSFVQPGGMSSTGATQNSLYTQMADSGLIANPSTQLTSTAPFSTTGELSSIPWGVSPDLYSSMTSSSLFDTITNALSNTNPNSIASLLGGGGGVNSQASGSAGSFGDVAPSAPAQVALLGLSNPGYQNIFSVAPGNARMYDAMRGY